MDPMHRGEVGHTSAFKTTMDGPVAPASLLDSHSNEARAACGTETQGAKNLQLKVQSDSQKPNSSRSKMTLNHQCPKCLKAFCSPSKLQRHFLIHTGQKPYSCAVCLKSFTQKEHLKSHLKTASECSLSPINERKRLSLSNNKSPSSNLQPIGRHTSGNSPVALELKCKISVNAEQELKTENTSDADVKSDQWVNTSSRCSSFQEREGQFIADKDPKPFQCTLCSRSFHLEVNLARHRKIHRNQEHVGKISEQTRVRGEMSSSEALKLFREPSQADATGLNVAVKPNNWSETSSNYVSRQVMNSVGQLRKNIQATSRQPRHQCCACCKSFPSVSKLHRHMMTHTGERPFSCETCGKRFRQKTHLRVHCRTHLWSKYHKQRSLYINRPLSRVGGHCRTSADVLKEMVLREKEARTRACADEIAAKRLDQISSIDVIRNNDEREPKNKLLPGASKNSEGSSVNKGSKVANWRPKSTQHPGNTRHRCFQCLKCFPCPSKLKRHEMVHAGVKPFKCPACGKTFGQVSHLKVHERTHSEMKPSLTLGKLPPWPTITGSVPPQKRFENAGRTHSGCDGVVGNRESVLPCTVSNISITKCLKSNTTVAPRKQSKQSHRCQMCSKYFQSPYKLSRHSLTHSGVRPYKCTVCSKAFTQRSHLKAHEHRCGLVRISASDCTRIEMINTAHTQDVRLKGLGLRTDATRDRQQSHSGAGHGSFRDEEAKWLLGPELGTKESGAEQRDDCAKAAEDWFSFPSALAREINKLVQNQQASATLSHVYDYSACDVERQDGEFITISDSDEHMDSVVENQIRTQLDSDGCWCETPSLFESEGFSSTRELEQQICPVDVQPNVTASAAKHHCDICFKNFVSPSKLTRHYLIHTGQRPFKCAVCGRAFTQASHARTHERTHSIKRVIFCV